MGSGLHGLHGLPASTCLKLYNAYVIPRALYGLETTSITEASRKKLVAFHKTTIRRLLGLPTWVGTPALYIISGQLPIEAQLDIKILTFIQKLLNIQPTRNILLHQYATKNHSSNSKIVLFKTRPIQPSKHFGPLSKHTIKKYY